MIFSKKHQLIFHDIFKNFKKQFSKPTDLNLITSFLSSELLSNGVAAARFALFGKLDVFKPWFILHI